MPKDFDVKVILSVLKFFSWLPYRLVQIISYPIATFMILAFPARRSIAYKNLKLCFPNMHPVTMAYLLYKNMRSTFMGLIEASIVWNYSNKAGAISAVEGLENIPQDRGCILITYHHSSTELAGWAIMQLQSFDGFVYRFKNDYFSDYITSSREKLYPKGVEFFPHDGTNFKAILKRLRSGNKMFYAPDIDLRSGNVTYRDFLSAKAPWEVPSGKFIKLANVDVVPYSVHRQHSKVIVKFHPAIINYSEQLSVDDIITRVNNFTEQQVNREPEDYLWVFKRFFTQPGAVNGELYNGN